MNKTNKEIKKTIAKICKVTKKQERQSMFNWIAFLIVQLITIVIFTLLNIEPRWLMWFPSMLIISGYIFIFIWAIFLGFFLARLTR